MYRLPSADTETEDGNVNFEAFAGCPIPLAGGNATAVLGLRNVEQGLIINDRALLNLALPQAKYGVGHVAPQGTRQNLQREAPLQTHSHVHSRARAIVWISRMLVAAASSLYG